MSSQSGLLLLLLSFLFCFVSISLQASISLGSGFSVDDDGLGFLATYKNSKFAITCTCIREVDANGNIVRDSFMETGVKQNITTLSDMADFKHWTMGLGVLQPSGASYLWDIKLAKQDTTIASVPGSSLQVAVPEGGLKTNILVNWPVALASTNKFQICQHVSWSINADDLGEGSLVPNTYIKNSAGSVIGVQIHGNFKFSFSMPGQVLLQNSGQNTNSSSAPGSLKDYSVAITGEKYSLSGSVELVLTTEAIGEQMQFDPLVTFNASFAACLKPLSIAAVLLAALALAWLA